MRITLVLLVCFPLCSLANPTWKAGLARTDITPRESMWLAGYAGRDRPSEGTLHPLWVKALALEDAAGQRVVLLTSDLCGMPRWMDDSICARLLKKHGLKRDQIRITNSHNHCAPAVRDDLGDYYPLDEEQRRRVNTYSEWLEEQIVRTIDTALSRLAPARLRAGVGECTFAVNRRNNKEEEVPAIRARGEALKGPVDHTVPVLAVYDTSDKLLAVVFGYACHNTVLSFYKWCGDYAGFAQIALEKSHPGAVALFVAGCGGDQNPLPRRSVELAEKYGNELAASVERVLASSPRALAPRLRSAFTFVPLPYDRNPSREELQSHLKSSNPVRARWARRMLAHLDAGLDFDKERPYAVQVWRFDDQLWISLGGEALVDYALRFRKTHGAGTWVTSYYADLTAYIPSERNWEEGGYEVAYLYEYQLPADRWARGLEERIARAVGRLVQEVSR